MNKRKFWKIEFNISWISLLLFLLYAIIFSEEIFLFNVLCWIGIIGWIIFTFGMAYHAYKQKKYFWMFALIFLGSIFPIIFYHSHFKKENYLNDESLKNHK